MYIFIDKSVFNEFRTYERNKENKDISYASVDDIRIFNFIDEINNLPIGNPIASFETTSDITDYLKEQWSGLFQRLLSESSKQKEITALNEIKSTAKTLNQLVSFLIEERKNGDQAFKEILLSNHPAFSQIRELLKIPYRVFFTNLDELNDLLLARQFSAIDESEWDNKNIWEWINPSVTPRKLLKIKSDIFDDDLKLKVYTPDTWDKKLIALKDISDIAEFDDDIPF
ncbi:hypothetical protein ACF8C6_05500 [Pseudomonas sp. zbq_18]|uniref:hypothetical protein n=1 Tax=Pseudomonas sp. zbq_18 TaxID=3367251 RepID=UPI00370A546E